MNSTATLIEAKDLRSMLTNSTRVVGLRDWIELMTEMALDWLRPRRKMEDGWPWARKMAVWAPRPPSEGPVMTTTRNVEN